jgi:Fe-S-cluster containining protein
MRGEVKFNCNRCGYCCSNLIAEDQGVTKGLTLLPNEVKYFPNDFIKPAIGIGKDPKEKGFKVIAYQFTDDICPHLKLGSCDIYRDRPHSCRQFPFSFKQTPEGEKVIGIDLNCPSVLLCVQELGQNPLMLDNLESAEKLFEIGLDVVKNPQTAWFYDLRKGSWISLNDLKRAHA